MANGDRQVKAHDRQLKALELRKAGVSYQAIADQLGFRSRGSAHNAVMAVLRKTLQEPADEVRQLELERLDALLMGMYPQARKGNQGAVDRCLRIMERRAKLLGLDAPTKAELSGKDGAPLVLAIGGLDPAEDI